MNKNLKKLPAASAIRFYLTINDVFFSFFDVIRAKLIQ